MTTNSPNITVVIDGYGFSPSVSNDLTLKQRIEELEKENRSLKREIMQRMDIQLEDLQTIRKLSNK